NPARSASRRERSGSPSPLRGGGWGEGSRASRGEGTDYPSTARDAHATPPLRFGEGEGGRGREWAGGGSKVVNKRGGIFWGVCRTTCGEKYWPVVFSSSGACLGVFLPKRGQAPRR